MTPAERATIANLIGAELRAYAANTEARLQDVERRLAAAEAQTGERRALVTTARSAPGTGSAPQERAARIVEAVRGFVQRAVTRLEARIEALEARPAGLKYCGVWQPKEYRAGDVTTHDGSMWVAEVKTTYKPGGSGSGWTLCVKRGVDGRDLR